MQKLPKITLIRRTITTAAFGVLLTGIFSLGAGAPASASEVGATARPTGCHYELLGDWASARCQNINGGSYRALIICKDPETGKAREFTGGWTQRHRSDAYCQGGYTKGISAGIETRVTG